MSLNATSCKTTCSASAQQPRIDWRDLKRKLWTDLKTVTDPKDGHAEIEHGRVDPGSIFVVYRVRGTGEDDTCESQRYLGSNDKRRAR